MMTRAQAAAGFPLRGLALVLGIWLVSGSLTLVHAGDPDCHYGPLWGEYGYGPHFNYRGSVLSDFGPPFFTHGMGCGIPYYRDFNGQGTGYGDFGPNTGAPPFPDTVPVYPVTSSHDSGRGIRYSSAYVTPASSRLLNATTVVRALGIRQEPVVDAHGIRGMKVAHVYPGTPAEQAGLRAGDVVHSTNGYMTTQAGNLAWIIANAAPNKVLTLNVRTSTDAKAHTITARLR
jgi:hypothetical protein